MNKRHTSRLIVITLPHLVQGEVEAISALCREPWAPLIHVRKPVAESYDRTQFLTALVACAPLDRMSYHYQETIARKYGFGGVHLRREEIRVGMGEGLVRSYSEHRLEALDHIPEQADYLFLSPIFDSISKENYGAAFDPCALQETLRSDHTAAIVALGGITPDHAAQAALWGFDGVATLGAVWAQDADGRIDTAQTLRNYRILSRRWRAASSATRLQFISDGDLATAEAFLQGGGRWIQLRMKRATEAEILTRGAAIQALCRRYDALFLLNDHPHLCAQLGADGVHLGEKDLPPAAARALLGEGCIIGATANRADQILAHDPTLVDYIGLGPYRFTTTKAGLAPLLGLEGYQRTLQSVRGAGCTLPIVAIGGIELPDIAPIMQSGVSGIALSGAIARAADPQATTTQFLTEITKKPYHG